MTDVLIFMLCFAAALGCGLMAGFFFAFSTAVMGGLARRPAAEAMAAMQSINLVVLNPVFRTAFFGTAAVCVWCHPLFADALGGRPVRRACLSGAGSLSRRQRRRDHGFQRAPEPRAGQGGSGWTRLRRALVRPISRGG